MARKLRLQYEGAIYHVMSRGDHREPVFRSRNDRELFLETLGQACAKTNWQVHAWCLVSNHFHLSAGSNHTGKATGKVSVNDIVHSFVLTVLSGHL